MTHGVLTNKFHATYNYEKIDHDFDIFMVTKESKKLNNTNILDIPTANFKALSVQYFFGTSAFVLFKKGDVDEFNFRAELQETFHDVTVQKVNLFDNSFRDNNFHYNDRLLAQLLINSIKSPKNKEFAYHNITGKLFYSDNQWRTRDSDKKVTMFYVLEAELTPGMYLKFSVNTFRLKQNNENKIGYIFDSKTGALRKKLKTDEKGDEYIIGSFKKSRNTIDYLRFNNFNSFQRSKLGVMRRFLSDVHTYLGDYMTLTPEYKDNVSAFEIPREQKKAMDNKHLAALINRPIVIVDELKTDDSSKVADTIKFELEYYYNLNPVVGELTAESYNIRIIHDDEYYKSNSLPDPHNNTPDDFIVQHITIESATEGIDKRENSSSAMPMLNKILQELLIKNDIAQGFISIFDWSKLDSDKTWTFVMRKKLKFQNDENKQSKTTRKENISYYFKYASVTINPDSKIRFDVFCDNDNILNDTQNKIIRAYEIFNSNEFRIKNDIEGLVYSDVDNIHAIVRTPMITMPDINAIYNGLEETDSKATVSKEQLLDALSEFANTIPEYKDYADYLKNSLNDANDFLTKSEFKKIMNYRRYRDKTSEWNRFLHNNYGIRIMPEIKSQDFDTVYLIENILDIKYYTEISHDGINEFRYFVGTKRASLQTSVHNACTVRKIISQTGEIEFKELLPLMAVDFVRNNQHTVLPFPYKFLREYLVSFHS